MIEQTYKLDLVPQGFQTVVHVSQYDVGSRKLTFELQKDGVAYEPPAMLDASISGRKPDRHIFYYPMDVEGNKVSIVLEQQMTVIPGDVECKIVLTSSGEQIASARFILSVEITPINNADISESDIPIFEALVNQAQLAAAEAKAQAEAAEDAAASVTSIPVLTVESIWNNTSPDYEEGGS